MSSNCVVVPKGDVARLIGSMVQAGPVFIAAKHFFEADHMIATVTAVLMGH